MVVAVNPGVVLPFLGGYDRICIRFVRGRRLRFDAFIFREFVISAITIKKIRHAIDENVFVEKLFPDEVEALRSLPLPLNVLRKLWMRTQKRAGMAPVLYLLRIPPERSASTGQRGT